MCLDAASKGCDEKGREVLIIAGTLEVDPDERAEFLESQIEGMRRSRDEPGCLAYVFSADPIDDGRVYLFERWESKEALAAHIARQQSAPPKASGVRAKSHEVQQYEIERVGPIGS